MRASIMCESKYQEGNGMPEGCLHSGTFCIMEVFCIFHDTKSLPDRVLLWQNGKDIAEAARRRLRVRQKETEG